MSGLVFLSGRQIINLIYSFKGVQVMVDRDLAQIYNVETRVLNQAVKRNTERFPADFMFQLDQEDFENWRSQIVISNSDKMGLRRAPYVFTEQGVAMLSAVLKSDTAVKVSIQIMQAFTELRKALQQHQGLLQRVDQVESRLSLHDEQFERIFSALEKGDVNPAQGIFFDGQTFDAYSFVSKLIRSAKKSILLIDNYVDETVLILLSKRRQGVEVTIYTQSISKQLQLDLDKHNGQYPTVSCRILQKSHDRFLVLDGRKLYHIGASLKDLGKKWFAFSRMQHGIDEFLKLLKNSNQ